ncbi:glycosyltransferase family 2 protein [Faunimonas pinastri]
MPADAGIGDAGIVTGGRQRPSPVLRSMFTPLQAVEMWVLAAAWIASLVFFWAWWFRPEHVIGTGRMVANSLILGWLSVIPAYFVFIALRAQVPSAAVPVRPGQRVAMVVTKAPSEPFAIVRETLEAMLRQTYAHDTWLADEDPTPEAIAWCEAKGVAISTRKGRADYHRATWPRRTRCKEGNLAFFYDRFGYDRYDFVAQLDADHVPAGTYLEEMLRPFADPRIGYVSAPSICDRNAGESWSARARLYAEGALHGALQAGYTNGLAPLCFGSHYAVRTAALKEIGGLGPELAEDHSTSLFMNAGGWRGVHAIDAIAHGDGPRTFADMATQEFQWSRSLMMILLQYTPGLLARLPWRLKLQFLFCQIWYPLFSLMMPAMYLVPLAALVFDVNMVGVTYPEFAVRFGLATAFLLAFVIRLRQLGGTRPGDSKLVSWEATLFLFARWPWSLMGVVAACRDWWMGKTVEFRVTPKGNDGVSPLPVRVILPYALLSLGSGLPVLLLGPRHTATGFILFALMNCLLYALLTLTILIGHLRESWNGRLRSLAGWLFPSPQGALLRTGLLAVMLAVPAIGVPREGGEGLRAVLAGSAAVAARIPGHDWLARAMFRTFPEREYLR